MRLRRRRSELRVAPLRLRFVASLINLLIGVGVLALAIGTAAGTYFIARRTRLKRLWPVVTDRKRPKTVRPSDRDDFRERASPLVAKTQSRPVRLALYVFSFLTAVRRDRRPSVGARAVGIRVVDARTGREPYGWQTLVRVGTRQAWRAAATHLIPWPKAHSPYEDETFRSDVEEARRRYSDDQQALQEALARIHREHGVRSALMSCLPLYLRLLLTFAIEAPALWTPLKQGLPDKFARTVVIVERGRSPWPRLAGRCGARPGGRALSRPRRRPAR
jgi:uncharacterized RDD family membrane protein YckC